MAETGVPIKDLEQSDDGEAHLTNITISSLAWQDTSVQREWLSSDRRPKQLITKVDGLAVAGKHLQSNRQPDRLISL